MINFITGCLKWYPEDRLSPDVILNDNWEIVDIR